MTKSFYLSVATAVLITLFGVSANAQSGNRQQLRVNVPFGFNVGNTNLPAGEYRVSLVNPSSDRSVLQFASDDGRTLVMIGTINISGWPASKAKLSFRHYGDQYFLAQVWMATDATGLATPPSSSERTLRRQLGKVAKNVGMVAVNAR